MTVITILMAQQPAPGVVISLERARGRIRGAVTEPFAVENASAVSLGTIEYIGYRL